MPPGDSARGDSPTEVMDGDRSVAGARANRPLPLLSLRLRASEPGRRESATSAAAAVLATLALVVVITLPASVALRAEAVEYTRSSDAVERVVFFSPFAPSPVEPTLPAPVSGAVVESPARAPVTPRPLEPGTPGGAPADTAAATDGPVDPSRSRSDELLRALRPPGRLGAGVMGGAGVAPARSGCAAPCREAAAAGFAPGTELQRRDSVLRELAEDAAARAGPAQRAPGFQVGLPGGGPTAAERERDSILHIEYRTALDRIRARHDSARADSVRRGLIPP
ncbi:MAG TPA: hypothetical protein VMM18_01705 [Gemmatimonadaceae bacterium]|nr:hypothetical protein [Gemmatimonadaceae bacterium]